MGHGMEGSFCEGAVSDAQHSRGSGGVGRGAFALGVGIGMSWAGLIIATEVVILAAGLVPSLVDLRDVKPRGETAKLQTVRTVTPWSTEIENVQEKTAGGRLVLVEPSWQHLH
jgi:hypothetical protein